MKKFDELNYYEILKIPMNSSYFEIKQAHKDALTLYDQNSVLTYSLFTREERDEILKKINLAHSTLIDDHKRAAYDRMLVDSGQVNAPISFRTKQYRASLLSSGRDMADKERMQSKVKEKIDMESIQNLSKALFSKEVLSGNDLKKFREALGVDIMEIHSNTKISMSVLCAIEENRFDRLPPDTYLKNFLKSYAKMLHLDPQKIVDGYFKAISLSHPADG
jgi:DnaJ-class molecular chaperone